MAFLCRVLKVSRSAYYAWTTSRPARRLRQRAEAELVAEIRVLHAASRGAYGAPRIHAALRRAGRVINEKKVERLMREHCITGITRCRRRGLTRQARRAMFAVDLIGRDFAAPRRGMRLVGDMTELVTAEGKTYLATCIDLAMREVIGWAMADRHRAELPVAALRMAASRGGLEPGCIMHNDRLNLVNARVMNSAKRYASWTCGNPWAVSAPVTINRCHHTALLCDCADRAASRAAMRSLILMPWAASGAGWSGPGGWKR